MHEHKLYSARRNNDEHFYGNLKALVWTAYDDDNTFVADDGMV